jgi:hypothetical protein
MTFKELVAQADAEIRYPLEPLLEKKFPALDRVMDVLCYAVLSAEVFIGSGNGAKKKEIVMLWISVLFARLPIRAPMIAALMQLAGFFVDRLVAWLNEKFPAGFGEAVEGVTVG